MNILRGESNLVQWVQTSHLDEMMQPCNCFTHANKILHCWKNNACTIWRLLHMLCWNTMIKQCKYNTELAMSPRGNSLSNSSICYVVQYTSVFSIIYIQRSARTYKLSLIFLSTQNIKLLSCHEWRNWQS